MRTLGWTGRGIIAGAVVGVMAALPLTGCGERQDSVPERQVILERSGSFRGIALDRSRKRDILHRFPGFHRVGGSYSGPLGEAGDDSRGATDFGCRGRHWEIIRYRDKSFVLGGGVVCDWLTIDKGAATKRGVAIGDPLSDVTEQYPALECAIASLGETLTFPYCAGMLAHHRYIWFGGDPIEAIEMNTSPGGFVQPG
jgi:hypothetical protein